MDKGKHKRYNVVFKEKAMRLADEIGCSRAARVLGIKRGTLGMMLHLRALNMKSMSNKTPEQKAALAAAQEIKRLKKENEDLKKANIILREVASFFSRDPLPTSLGWSEKLPKKGQA